MKVKRTWEEMVTTESLADEIIEAVKKQKTWESWQEIRYVPNPAKWLEDGRWLDEDKNQNQIIKYKSWN